MFWQLPNILDDLMRGTTATPNIVKMRASPWSFGFISREQFN
jgi:hypothetical protein